MRLLYSDGASIGRSGPIQLLRLENNWYVVGPGFVFAVDGEQEGATLVRRLKAAQITGDPLASCVDSRLTYDAAGRAT